MYLVGFMRNVEGYFKGEILIMNGYPGTRVTVRVGYPGTQLYEPKNLAGAVFYSRPNRYWQAWVPPVEYPGIVAEWGTILHTGRTPEEESQETYVRGFVKIYN